MRNHLVVPVGQHVTCKPVVRKIFLHLHLLIEPGGQLNHPDPEVGVVDVEVVGDAPHDDQVHLRVKEKG